MNRNTSEPSLGINAVIAGPGGWYVPRQVHFSKEGFTELSKPLSCYRYGNNSPVHFLLGDIHGSYNQSESGMYALL